MPRVRSVPHALLMTPTQEGYKGLSKGGGGEEGRKREVLVLAVLPSSATTVKMDYQDKNAGRKSQFSREMFVTLKLPLMGGRPRGRGNIRACLKISSSFWPGANKKDRPPSNHNQRQCIELELPLSVDLRNPAGAQNKEGDFLKRGGVKKLNKRKVIFLHKKGA